MTPHDWYVEEVDGGALGIGHFWKCRVCFASGGPKQWDWRQRPFLAGRGLKLPLDCDKAAEKIQRYWEKEGKRKKVYTK
jgi:hypothetical protein